MRLSPFDDYPFHQTPTPFATAATSDVHYNDGYFCAFYAPDWYFFTGLRLHPNVNVIDGWASVAHADRQTAVRASRALHPRYDELAVGPVRYEIIEPMKRLRLVADENPADIEFDVVLEAQSPPFIEDRYQHFRFGAVVNDLIRYTQICRATGSARVAGETIEIDSWHAMRDHSWGVRSSMGAPTGIKGTDRNDEPTERRALRMWVPFQVADHCGFYNTHEDPDGKPIDFEGRLDYADGRSVHLTAVRHELEYLGGTKRPSAGTIELDGEDGVTRKYTLHLVGTPADVQAGGYYRGWSDNLGPGIYRGAEVIEHDSYDVSPGAETTGPPHVPVKYRLGPTEYPMHMIGPGGAEGMAHFEHTMNGPYPRYGFD
jgi:hypothetical protein